MASTPPTTATQSIVAALGGGSGIDMAALATNIANAQFAARADRLAARLETLDSQISAASNLKSMLTGLSASLGERVRQGDLSPQPQLSNPAVAKATLSGAGLVRGNFSLEVTTLARAQTLASPAYASGASLVGSGTLTLRFGAASGAGFTADPGRPAVDVTIASGATLTDVARAINAKGAGVTAYVAQTNAGAQLVLKGASGEANGFVLEAVEAPGDPGLANLAWTPPAAPARLLISAANAAFSVDGLAMSAASNTVVDAIPGVSLSLTGTNTGAPAQVTFSDPASAISAAMQDLTGALNEIASALGAAADPRSGELARDSGALALKRSFSSLAGAIIMPTAPTGAPTTLADLGLTTQRDGSFALDSRRLAATLKADASGAAAMFTNGLFGVYASIDSIARRATTPGDPGTLAGSLSRYTAQRGKASDDQAKLSEQQETLRSQLTQRFAVADSRIGTSKSTLNFLKNQIAAWNGSNN